MSENLTLVQAVRDGLHDEMAEDDDDRRYRPESDREEARHKDPIAVFGRYLHAHDLLDDEQEAAMRARVLATVAEALEQAEASPEPSSETAFDHVYAGVRVPDFRAPYRDVSTSPSRAVKTTP